MSTNRENPESEQQHVRLEKLKKIRAQGINPYPARAQRTHKTQELHDHYIALEKRTVTQDRVFVAGKIMSMRNSGMFIDLHDDAGKIQIYTDLKELTPEHKVILDNLDEGDFISVGGLIRRTPRGELTVNAQEISLLAKSLRPFPDRYYGLNDTETRYRQRYIDLIANPATREVLLKRSKIMAAIRHFLVEKGFLEVETPMLHPIPGGAIAKPFVTHHKALEMDLYLRIAPELYLKKLIVGGLSEKIFEINRCFRNEGVSTRHNPEFTSLELYQAYADYTDMIDIVENLLKSLCFLLYGTEIVSFLGQEIVFSGKWPRKPMISLVQEKTGIHFLDLKTDEEARQKAKSLGIPLKGTENWGQVVEAVFGEKVEASLIQPIHVTDFPTDISPLSKAHGDEPRLTERFETYINGWEIANGFSELNDPREQRARFLQQVNAKEKGDEEAHDMDHDFLTALEYAMPPTGGLGIGLDRLTMILTNSASIKEVIAFPTLKSKN